ncbi:MAG TPA: hypothetical protein VFS00_13210, partial [Polyangiaceae bacterium]|nr:hypothetical protein [Polyangiaceae bacterium]
RIVDPSGRRHGARVRLTDRSAEGWPEGDFSAPAPPAGGPAWLVVSASADGGPGVSLPLPPGDEPRDGAWVSDLLWVDGLVEASADDRARGRRARWAVAALVASGALLEAWLLVALQRARGPLEVVSGAGFGAGAGAGAGAGTGAGAGGGGPDEGDERVPLRPLRVGWLAVVLGVVWLGFVVVGILLGAGLG